ncbi:MAG: response regulator transcription factor [candidate division Zixibacteria bacterium]|nr:response regulator transcription factor [candidate division Zixibacteria bacterium]
MNPRVLLVEDDPNLGLIVQEHLQLNGFDVVLCENGETALAAFGNSRFALCLVDVMMPRMDGFTFARQVRRKDDATPLIFLTAKSLREDKIEGFRIGCDDYVTKPFSVEELLLRIQAVLRRSSTTGQEERTSFTIGEFTFDAVTRTLRIGQQERKLTSRESELLRLLCLHQNKTLDRSLALREIWGDDNYFNARSMDVFVSKLRKYLKDDPHIEISSVHGVGFSLTVTTD